MFSSHLYPIHIPLNSTDSQLTTCNLVLTHLPLFPSPYSVTLICIQLPALPLFLIPPCKTTFPPGPYFFLSSLILHPPPPSWLKTLMSKVLKTFFLFLFKQETNNTFVTTCSPYWTFLVFAYSSYIYIYCLILITSFFQT